MKRIAITGNIACGKSCAFDIIKDFGCKIIDSDDIVNGLYEENSIIEHIEKLFPKVVSNNNIDKKALSNMLFSDKIQKQKFENFLYPKVLNKINEFFEENKSETTCFVIVPLLFEAGFEKYFDKILLITADEEIRKERLIKRNSVLSNCAEKVIASQIPQDKKTERCDYIIENNGTLEEFKNAVERFLKAL